MKVAITGHRIEEYQGTEADRTFKWIESMGGWMADRGMTEIISGMAAGADLWWAQQHQKQEIPLHGYVPYWKQALNWETEWIMFWDEMILDCTDVTVFGKSEPYDVTLFHKRNEAMVADADEMLVVWKEGKSTGGTYSTFQKWKATGKPWHWYDPLTNTVKHGHGETIDE